MPLPPFISEPLEAILTARHFKRLRRRELYTLEFTDGEAAIQFVRDKFPSGPSEAHFTAHLGFRSNRLSAAASVAFIVNEVTVRGIPALSETRQRLRASR